MTDIIMHGASGRMGKVITQLCAQEADFRIAAGVDVFGEGDGSFPFFSSLDDCNVPADVLIDFSTATAVDGVLSYCVSRKLPLVLCTTGLSQEQIAAAERASQQIAILRSGNMSVGVNVILDILKEVAPKLYAAGFDIEIVEKHHNQKVDAPSGTAEAMAEEIRTAVDDSLEEVYDRTGRRARRDRREIGVSAVRGGTIVGDHDVIFAGTDEVVTISHRAYSRAIFARGAITAAAFLAGRAPGMYTMRDALSGV